MLVDSGVHLVDLLEREDRGHADPAVQVEEVACARTAREGSVGGLADWGEGEQGTGAARSALFMAAALLDVRPLLLKQYAPEDRATPGSGQRLAPSLPPSAMERIIEARKRARGGFSGPLRTGQDTDVEPENRWAAAARAAQRPRSK